MIVTITAATASDVNVFELYTEAHSSIGTYCLIRPYIDDGVFIVLFRCLSCLRRETGLMNDFRYDNRQKWVLAIQILHWPFLKFVRAMASLLLGYALFLIPLHVRHLQYH